MSILFFSVTFGGAEVKLINVMLRLRDHHVRKQVPPHTNNLSGMKRRWMTNDVQARKIMIHYQAFLAIRQFWTTKDLSLLNI